MTEPLMSGGVEPKFEAEPIYLTDKSANNGHSWFWQRQLTSNPQREDAQDSLLEEEREVKAPKAGASHYWAESVLDGD
jgi:hypothetical protein